VPFYLHHMSTVGDRYLYLALPGPALALAWALWRAGRDHPGLRGPLLVGAALVLAVLGVHSFRLTSVWRDSVPMLEHTIAMNPASAYAHNNLGVTLGRRQRPAEFLEHARRAAELRPDMAEFVNNLGTAYGQNGDLRAALAAFERAVEINPRHARAHYHLGSTLDDLGGSPARAVEALRTATRLDPALGEAWFRLGVALGKAGDTDAAVAALRRVTVLRPDRADAHYIAGVLLGNAGRNADAEASLADAVRYQPGYAEARFALGRVREKLGRPADALPEYREAVRLAPDNARFARALQEAERRASGR